MRIVRVSASDQPTYGILGDASKRVIALTGDPLFHKVEQSGQFFELEDVRLLSPVIPRSKALVLDPVGVAGDVAAQHVTLIPNTAIAGPDDPIVFPAWAHEVTVEPALAIVVKTLVKDVSPAAARTLILGTCLAARFRASGVDDGLASTWDRCCPIGPWVEVEEGQDPQRDGVTVEVGEQVRDYAAGCWGIADAVAQASAMATLLPGDIILVPWPGQMDVTAGQHVTVSHGLLGDLHCIAMPQQSAATS